jgi:hypothetical protein
MLLHPIADATDEELHYTKEIKDMEEALIKKIRSTAAKKNNMERRLKDEKD